MTDAADTNPPVGPPQPPPLPPPPFVEPLDTEWYGTLERPLQVSSVTQTTPLASCITIALRKADTVVLVAMGEKRINTVVKAAAAARNFLRREGWDLTVAPEFVTLPNRDRPDVDLSAIQFVMHRVPYVRPVAGAASAGAA